MQGLPKFTYIEPSTINEAVSLSHKYGVAAKVFAGGLDLVPRLRLRKIELNYLISIQRIPGLDYIIDEGENGLRIGAMTVLHAIETSSAVRDRYNVLYEAVSSIASLQVKMMGTVVGNLCVATPASDIAPSLIVLDSTIRIAGPKGERAIPVENLFKTVGQTTLRKGEIVTEILIPPCKPNSTAGFAKLIRTASDIAKVNVAVSMVLSNNICQGARIALGSVAPTTIRAPCAEALLEGKTITSVLIDQVANQASKESKPIDDIRSTAEYRRHAAGILIKRLIEKLIRSKRL